MWQCSLSLWLVIQDHTHTHPTSHCTTLTLCWPGGCCSGNSAGSGREGRQWWSRLRTKQRSDTRQHSCYKQRACRITHTGTEGRDSVTRVGLGVGRRKSHRTITFTSARKLWLGRCLAGTMTSCSVPVSTPDTGTEACPRRLEPQGLGTLHGLPVAWQ